MSSPPVYTSIPSVDPSEPQPQPQAQSFATFHVSEDDGFSATVLLPFYPLLILLLHFLIALRLLPISDTNSLLLFIFFSITLFLIHDRLVLLIVRPKTKLDFIRQRWIAMNTQLAGALVSGGFLIVPIDGKWSDARGWLVFLGIFVMLGMVIYVNGSNHDAINQERARLNPQPVVVGIPVIADLAEQGVENEVLFDGEVPSSSSHGPSDLEAQLEGRSK